MYQINYVLYKEGGVKLDGSIDGYRDLSKEIDMRVAPLYVSSSDTRIIIGSLIRVSAERSREERLVYFQEISKEEFFVDTNRSLINYFKEINEAVNSAYKSVYKISRIGEESINYEVFIEKLERDLLEKDDNGNINIRDVSSLFGRILSSPSYEKRVTKVYSNDLFDSISFIATCHRIFPLLLQEYTVVIAKDIFTQPVDILITQRRETTDYEIQNGKLNFSELEKKIYQIYFNFYEKHYKDKSESRDVIRDKTMDIFPLSIIKTEKIMGSILDIPNLKEFISDIIKRQFSAGTNAIFIKGYESYDKEKRISELNKIENSPYYGKIFFQDLEEKWKNEKLPKYQRKYHAEGYHEGYDNGYEKGKFEGYNEGVCIHNRNVILYEIVLPIIIVLLTILLIIQLIGFENIIQPVQYFFNNSTGGNLT